MNTTIKDVTKAIDEFHFNIAVAQIRSLFNLVSSYDIENENDVKIVRFVTSKLLILINPMVPHLSEELWFNLGNENSISNVDFSSKSPMFADQVPGELLQFRYYSRA